MSPAITAIGVPITEASAGNRCRVSRRKLRTGPLSSSRTFQLIVRIRKLVKNGAITMNSRKFFQRPPRKAIV